MPPVTSLVQSIVPTKSSVRRGSSGHYFNALPDQATANTYASMYDIIMSNPAKYQAFANGMVSSAGNTKLILGSYDKSIQSDASVNYPSYMYSHDSGGAQIPVGFSSKYTQMQADRTGAVYTDSRGFTATSWKEWVSRDHWRNLTSFNAGASNQPMNSIYFDSMDEWDGNPVSWQDGHTYSRQEFNNLTWTIGDFAISIRPQAGLWVGGNGLKSGSYYMGSSTDPANPNGNSASFPSHLDWALAEDFVRGNFDGATAFPSDSDLEKSINLVKSAAIKKVMFWCVVNLQNFAASPGHAGISITSAQVDQWHRYSIAAWLIGNDGWAVYEFVENTKTVQGWQDDHPYYHAVLGLPLDNKTTGSAYKNATTGLYTRNFENGTAYVNNTSAPVTFNPGTGYTQVNGTAISGTVTVGAHDGLVLLHTASGGGGGGATAGKKYPIQGICARDATSIATNWLNGGAFNAMTVNVNWKDLQDTNTSTLSGSGIAKITNAIAYCRANSLQLKLRIQCGTNSPAWLKTSVGTFNQVDVPNYNNGDHSIYTIPKFWVAAFLTAYDNFMSLMAASYDSIDVLADVTISNAGTVFAEPLLRQVGISNNRAEMVGGGLGWQNDGSGNAIPTAAPVAGAGYSDAANKAALKQGIDICMAHWNNVNLSFAFNPYNVLLSSTEAGFAYANDNQVYDGSDDATLSNTAEILNYFKNACGNRGVTENNSTRDNFFTYNSSGKATGLTSGAYGLLYQMILSNAPNSFFQTANSGPVGDIDKVMDGLTNIMHANAIEVPTDYVAQSNAGTTTDWEWQPANFAKYNTLLLGNPVLPLGSGGGGTGGGTYTDNLIVNDTYTRTVAPGGLGTADSGHTYTITSGSATDFQVTGTQAVVANTIAGRTHGVWVNGFARQDMHGIALWSFDEAPAGDIQAFQLWLRVDNTLSNGYRLRCVLNPTTNTLQATIQKVVAGAATTIGTVFTVPSLVPQANTVYVAEMQATGINSTTLEASFYRLADGAPAAGFQITQTDAEATLQVGTGGIAWNMQTGSLNTNVPVNGLVTDFKGYERQAVVSNALPSIDSTDPVDGASLQIGLAQNTITQQFSVTASDVDDQVVGVVMSVNGGVDQTMTLTGGQWRKTLNLVAGTYSIQYTATDSVGLQSSKVINITVLAPPTPTSSTVFLAPYADYVNLTPNPEFSIVHILHDGTPIGEVQGTDVRFGKFIGSPGFISYDVHRSHPMAQLGNSEPHKIDFSLTREGIELLSGELLTREADTDTDMVSITGNDWMNYMDQIVLPFDPENLKAGDNFTRVDTDLTDIAEGLIQKVLNGYDNTIDIAMNNQKTGIITSQQFIATDLASLKSMIDSLAAIQPGFEWEITHDLRFIMYAPQRNDQSLYRLDASNIKGVHYGLEGVPGTTVYGRGSGSGSATAFKRASLASASGTYRDRINIVDFGTISSRAVLGQLTLKKLAELSKQRLQFWVTMYPRPNENVYAAVAPGQYVYIDWNDGFIELQGWYRCAGFEGFVNAKGDEEITFNFDTDNSDVSGATG